MFREAGKTVGCRFPGRWASVCDCSVAWSVALVPVALLPATLPGLGWLYVAVAAGLGVVFLQRAWRLRVQKDEQSARGLFLFSLVYLLGCFAAMIVDLALGAWL